jgi:hypothetical protein
MPRTNPTSISLISRSPGTFYGLALPMLRLPYLVVRLETVSHHRKLMDVFEFRTLQGPRWHIMPTTVYEDGSPARLTLARFHEYWTTVSKDTPDTVDGETLEAWRTYLRLLSLAHLDYALRWEQDTPMTMEEYERLLPPMRGLYDHFGHLWW